MSTAACVVSLVQEGIRNFERPLFVDQLGMQGRQHFTDTDSFSDRPGTQEGKQEGMKKRARSSMREGTKKQSSMREGTRKQSSMRKGMKKQSSMRGGMKKRSSMREGMKNAISPPFDVKGQVRDLDFVARRLQSAISPPLDLLDFFICGATLQRLRRRGNQSLVEGCSTPPGDKIGGGNG